MFVAIVFGQCLYRRNQAVILSTMAENVDLISFGKHCHVKDCKKLDFLPFKCTFCQEYFWYDYGISLFEILVHLSGKGALMAHRSSRKF